MLLPASVWVRAKAADLEGKNRYTAEATHVLNEIIRYCENLGRAKPLTWLTYTELKINNLLVPNIFCNTGRFIMLSVIKNIYNKKTKGPTLMELLTATGKLKKFFW
jgi:hypothetical protein